MNEDSFIFAGPPEREFANDDIPVPSEDELLELTDEPAASGALETGDGAENDSEEAVPTLSK